MTKMREVLYYRIWTDGKRDYGNVFIPVKTKRRRLHKTVRKAVAEFVWGGPPPVEVGYYGEVPPGEHIQPEPLTVTDTQGNAVKRFGRAGCLRTLMNPVNFSGGDPDNYALICCRALGIGIYRWGHRPRKAKFVLYSAQGHSDEYVGIEGRDRAIAKFIRMVKKGKPYLLEYRSSYAHQQIPADVVLGRRVERLVVPPIPTGRSTPVKRKRR